MSYSLKALVGGTLYDLPHYKSAQLGYEFSDVSGLILKYRKGGINSDRLVEDAVVIAYWNGVEPFDSRWWIQAGDGSDEVEYDAFGVTGKSLLDIFRRVVVLPATGAPAGSTVKFNAATAGGILVNLFTAAQAAGRGAMTGVTWNFSATVDSAGVAWDKVITLEYKPGLKYIDVIRNLVDQGMIEVRFNGTQFQAFIGDKMGSDLSVAGTSQVELVAGRDYTELPSKWSTEERAKYAYVIGDENAIVARTSAVTATGPFGREEIGLSQGGTKDVGTLTLVGDAALERVAEKRREFTRKVKIRADGKIPSVDYRVSDYILERVNDLPDRYRVRSMVVDITADGSVGDASIVLNDRFLEQEIRQARRVNGIIGGASVDGGGNGVPVAEKPDTTTPGPPTGVVASSAAYTDGNGRTRGSLYLDWNPPTTNTDGSSITDLKQYEVQWKRAEDPDVSGWHTFFTTTDYANISNLNPGMPHNLKVRAWDNTIHASAWSPIINITTAKDTTPPPVPGPFTLDMSRGIFTIVTDGKGVNGAAMPADYLRTQIHLSTVNNFSATSATLVSYAEGAGRFPITGLDYDTTYYVKLVSEDTSNNLSAASAQVSGSISRLVGFDFASGSVGFDELVFKQPGNLVPDGSFESQDYRDALPLVSSWSFQGSGGFLGSWRISCNATISPSTYRLQRLVIDDVPSPTNLNPSGWIRVLPGDRFLFRCMVKRTADCDGFMNFGLLVYNSAGVRVSLGNSSQYQVLPTDPRLDVAYKEISFVCTVPAAGVWMTPMLETGNTATLGQWDFDIVEVRPIMETALIDDAAITTAKIKDLAVNDAKIQNLNVGKLEAGVMNADVTVSGQFATALSGARVTFNAAGMKAYNAAGTNFFNLTSASLTITATINGSTINGGSINGAKVRAQGFGDINALSNTDHALQVGPSATLNTMHDGNEIQARDGTAKTSLNLNILGGNVNIGKYNGGDSVTANNYLNVFEAGNKDTININTDYDGGFTGSAIRVFMNEEASPSSFNVLAATIANNNAPNRAYTMRGDGNAYADGAWAGGGADFAELFETADGHSIGPGKAVTLEGTKIRLAQAGDYVLGITSATPTIVGNNPLNWSGKYKKDVYGRYLEDENGVRLLSPNWEGDVEYVNRVDQESWIPVGLVGQVVADDDGTTAVGGYAVVGADGVLTAAENFGYRVMERIDGTHVRIIVVPMPIGAMV